MQGTTSLTLGTAGDPVSAKPNMTVLKEFLGGRSLVHAPGVGIACSLGGSFLIVANDAAIKAVSVTLPVGEIIALRGLVVSALVILYLWLTGQFDVLRVQHPRGQAGRALMMVCSSFLFIAALRAMPLADATAQMFVAPLILTAMAPIFLGERVGWHRATAVVVGFIGMIVILRPGADGVYWIALLPVAAAACSATRDLITRRISAGDSPLATLFYTTFAVAAAGLVTLPFDWQTPTAREVAILGAAAGLQLCAHFLMIVMYRFVQVSAVAPFKYSALVWAVILGMVLFGDVPDGWTIGGALLIIAGGLYVIHRERRRLPLP